jgi:preprotein translocase subunit SecE
MNRLFAYLAEARSELTKVTWPTRAQTIRLTAAVIVFSLVLGFFIGGLDYLFSLLLQKLILKV